MRLGQYHMKVERCFDLKAAWGVTSGIFFKCESSQATIRAQAGRLDLSIFGGAFLEIIRKHTPGRGFLSRDHGHLCYRNLVGVFVSLI